MTFKPIICIDFDGVLHSYTSGWQGDKDKPDYVLNGHDIIADPPVPGAIEWLRALVEGDEVTPAIYSSRSRFDEGIWAMKGWLEKHGLEQRYADCIAFPTQKPAAFLTIDDRAICFSGVFPTVDRMKAFKPWNKRGPAPDINRATPPHGEPQAMIALSTSEPVMQAWAAFKLTESFRNARHWARQEPHVDGSLWAMFLEGWHARGNAP